jgi:Tol biopolymer transport system component
MKRALFVLVVAASLSSNAGDVVPSTSAFVVKGGVGLVDVGRGTVTMLELPNFEVEDADLSPDKKALALTGRHNGDSRSKLFLLDLATQQLTQVPTSAAGDHRSTRFLPDGSGFIFVAALKDEVGGPDNPGRLHKYALATGAVTPIETIAGRCEFSPAPLGNDKVVSISTHCFVAYQILATSLKTGETQVIGSASGAWNELAASPSGKRVLYNAETPEGVAFFVLEKEAKKAKLLTKIASRGARLQPRFINEREVLYATSDAVWTLDSKSGKTRQLVTLNSKATSEGVQR